MMRIDTDKKLQIDTDLSVIICIKSVSMLNIYAL